jgi:hypothetical protein
MIRSLLCLAVALATVLPAQVQTTTYVQESVLGNLGNVGPLGCSPTGLLAESRSQILIPARYLPGPGAVLLGLGALGSSSSGTNTTLTYGLLRITISRATTLGASFAGNLPQPQTLLNVTNLTVPWQATAFTPITFVNTYTHDGSSSLVIDIQKIVSPIGDATMKTIANARRTDLPRMINAFGGTGSGAHAAATATVTTNSPLSLQLRWAGAGGTNTPTTKLKSDPTAPFRAPFEIGRTFDTTVQGQPGALFATLQGVALAAPPATFAGIAGKLWVANPVMSASGLLPASGQHTVTQTIPNLPSLVGFYLATQSLLVTPAGVWQWSNMADCFVTNGV